MCQYHPVTSNTPTSRVMVQQYSIRTKMILHQVAALALTGCNVEVPSGAVRHWNVSQTAIAIENQT